MATSDVFKPVEFDVNGRKISGISYGDEQGPLLLCLHGWLDNAASFQPLMPYLSNYHVIAIDWPGHGLSDHRGADAHYHFLDWVYDLISLFRSQQWQAIDIIGHSMGGMVASTFAAAFPEHVKSLTLIDCIGVLTSDEATTTKQLRKGLLSRLTRDNKAKKYHTHLNSAVAARVLVSDLSTDNATLIVKRGIEQTEAGFIWRADIRLRSTSPYRFTLAQAERLVADISTPVQLLYGSKGMEMVTKGLKCFGPLFKNLQVHELIGGHHVHMEQAEQAAKLINTFIHQRAKQ
ncbi:alpha/beta hydrolase [Colwellia sp. MB3u-70]|uniref:alpha/beta fold hydrolase n=1 Tax=unclassified Colwellia TaxID=196834 RepID=UPI0015F77414|nr:MULTISPECIES: alpha/beta hydrolase [unclassified Colwellia]MBA6290900.1 alpha/beta hydrolase [Colwellia sp. MB3u-8]MBA6306411.1 alpha/beta hydrolase [Colwellia sp. MB3u-70]